MLLLLFWSLLLRSIRIEDVVQQLFLRLILTENRMLLVHHLAIDVIRKFAHSAIRVSLSGRGPERMVRLHVMVMGLLRGRRCAGPCGGWPSWHGILHYLHALQRLRRMLLLLMSSWFGIAILSEPLWLPMERLMSVVVVK